MRPAREITAEEENFRAEEFAPGMSLVKRDPIKPEPEGTIILKAFRITGYDADCDGSLMARLDCIDKHGEETGWSPNALGINPDTCLVINQTELSALFEGENRRAALEEVAKAGRRMKDGRPEIYLTYEATKLRQAIARLDTLPQDPEES